MTTPFPRARSTDSITSHISADMAEPVAVLHSRLIMAWLTSHPTGGTKNAIADGSGLDHVAVARRMSELETVGKVRRSDEIGLTPAGRPATIWVKVQ